MPMKRREEDGLGSFQREKSKLFDDFFNGFGCGSALDWGEGGLTKAAFSPKIDVSETKKEVKVSAELPGMEEEDVAVELGDDVLTIRGEKKEDREDHGKDWYRKEQTFGSFHRAIPLPSSVEADKAKARFRKGKLTVIIPKTLEESSNRRSIEIETD